MNGSRSLFSLSLSALGASSPGLAIASLRAGATAWVDAEFLDASSETLASACRHIRMLTAAQTDRARVGLRLNTDQVTPLESLIGALAGADDNASHDLILRVGETPLDQALDLLPPASSRQVLLELHEVSSLDQLDPRIAGLVLCGNESGGWVGPDPLFILLQKYLASDCKLPFFVRGAISLGAAAACRFGGASGVVLDDQLLLMPESPLTPAMRRVLAEADGTEAMAVGEDGGKACRFFHRRDLTAAEQLVGTATSLGIDTVSTADDREVFFESASQTLGWGSANDKAWPVGQGIGLAGILKRRYRTTGRLLLAVDAASRSLIKSIQNAPPLAPEAELAKAHGCRYPVVQGPMTRVSDTPEFAESIADAGGLPMLALALMREDATRDLLTQTQARLGERPWGVGILGFVPKALRDEQLRAIAEVRPPFALIAGGRPDHAADLEAHGVTTYLHVPVPGLLKRFVDQGCRRFAFEGRECGGHVGPLSSFALWQIMVETLLEHASDRQLGEMHLLFAGGIHDPASAAMVSIIAAPLVERGARIGVILGTAYLFTPEAVASGAIRETFQREALDCTGTAKITTGPGHVIRCAPNPFVSQFHAEHRKLVDDGLSGDALREQLDQIGLGRARIASRGLVREGSDLKPVDEDRQWQDGMFMMGQLATLRRETVPMETLHRRLCEGSAALLQDPEREAAEHPGADRSMPAEVAIVGMSCLLPGAQRLDQYWRNLLTLPELITEVPRHRWDWRVIYSEEPKPDTTQTKWGGFFDEVEFEPLNYGIPPNSMKSLSTSQLLALEAVRWALHDAGYESGDFDRENTSVIVGTGANGDLEQHFMMRSSLPLVIENLTEDDWKRFPTWTEESFAGVLANVTAGRIANRFDFGGANYSVDAACATGLTVVDHAISELRTGRSNMVVALGLDFEQTPYFYQGFSRVQAVSPRGRARTFDQNADGIVISEGVGVVLLKRLDDALRDGDRIYGLIQSACGSSDGKALGMTAPRSIGQRRALRRAYEEAGISPAEIDLYEAHGTGTPVGDRAELETIHQTLSQAGAARKSCAVGSVKSLLGHTKAAAGIVGLIKATLAVYHQTLPPHANVDSPLPEIADPESPLYLLKKPRPWLRPDGRPRRAGVSAFGFGGTNYHAVVEEHRDAVCPSAPGGDAWPAEPFLVRATGRDELVTELDLLARCVQHNPSMPLRDLAYSTILRQQNRRGLAVTLGFVADSTAQLAERLTTAIEALKSGSDDPLGPFGDISWQTPDSAAKVAFLFPGQGTQEPNMLLDGVLYLAELRQALGAANQATAGVFDENLSDIVYPPASFSDEENQRQRQQVNHTHVAQPAIGALSMGMARFAARLGLKADMAVGHSYGELTALHVAGALTEEDFLRLSEVRGRSMAGAAGGTMAAVAISADDLEAQLGDESDIVIANRNAPDQCVISGPTASIAAASEKLREAGYRVAPLAVSGAFHSSLMAAADAPLRAAFDEVGLAAPAIPVYSNKTATRYPIEVDGIREHLREHLLSPVDFVGDVRAMYADGARIFVELGPGNVLGGLVSRILDSEPHTAVSLGGRGELQQTLRGLIQLETAGVNLDLEALFAGRPCRELDLPRLSRPAKISPTLWYVDGGRVRRPNDEVGTMGELPLLTLEQVEAARARNARQASGTAQTRLNAPINPSQSRAPGAPTPPEPAMNKPTTTRRDAIALEAYRDYQDTMRRFLATQENVMARILGAPDGAGVDLPQLTALPDAMTDATELPVQAASAESTPAMSLPAESTQVESGVVASGLAEASTDQPSPVAAGGVDPLDPAQIAAVLVDLVSGRTGYPPDMIDHELDLEAELGIDSIKRFEILDALGQTLPETVQAALQTKAEDLVREKSVTGWSQAVLRIAQGVTDGGAAGGDAKPTQAEPADAVPAKTNGNGGDGDGCVRYIVRPQHIELAAATDVSPTGLYVVTEDSLGVAPLVLESLKTLGAQPVLVARSQLTTPAQLNQTVDALISQHGPLRGLVHLAPLANGGDPDSLDDWQSRTAVEVKSLFTMLKGLAQQNTAEADLQVLGASLLGGAWNRSGRTGPHETGASSAGGIYGLLKTLKTEHPGVRASVVDFDSKLAPESIARCVVDELRHDNEAFEVGYPDGKRTVFLPEPAILEEPAEALDLLPQPGWVILATGGARGVTAELTIRMAGPGVQVVLVGRSECPESEDEATAGLDEGQLRGYFINRNKSADAPLRPAEIEARVRTLLRDREIRANIRRMKAAGAAVEYVACDVRYDLAATIDDIYQRHGRIDGVLHGAGVIEDHLLRDKSGESFDRVFDTKADSTFQLYNSLRRESLRWVVLMSSISGRIGNRGQIDYAAANEVMNRLAWEMSRSLAPARVLAINWGPWSGAGMASPAVINELAQRGIQAFDLDTGWEFLRRELLSGSAETVEVIAGTLPERSGGADDAAETVRTLNS